MMMMMMIVMAIHHHPVDFHSRFKTPTAKLLPVTWSTTSGCGNRRWLSKVYISQAEIFTGSDTKRSRNELANELRMTATIEVCRGYNSDRALVAGRGLSRLRPIRSSRCDHCVFSLHGSFCVMCLIDIRLPFATTPPFSVPSFPSNTARIYN